MKLAGVLLKARVLVFSLHGGDVADIVQVGRFGGEASGGAMDLLRQRCTYERPTVITARDVRRRLLYHRGQ